MPITKVKKHNTDRIGHTILSDTIEFQQRNKLKFVNATITDDIFNDTTIITTSSGSSNIFIVPTIINGGSPSTISDTILSGGHP